MAVLISVTEGDVTQIVLADVGVQGASGTSSASGTPFTPYGNIAATNVQTALQELDDEKFGKAGGTVTGNLEIGTGGTLSFEGATADGFETTLAVVDPTADRTLTLPNVTGTFVTTGDTGTVTSTMLLDGTILNADVNASAAIAGTKISPDFGSQTIVTTGVHSAAAGSAAAPSIAFTGDLDTGIYTPGANQVAVATSGTERLRVTDTGLVGMGTSSPASTLHVAGTFRTTGANYLGIGETTTLAYIGDPFTTNTRSIFFNRPSGALTGIVNIQGLNAGVGLTDISLQAQGGNVGIGTTSPAQLLHVSGSGTQAIRLENTLGTGNVNLELKLTNNTFTTSLNNTSIVYNDTAGREYIWYQNSAERMRLDTSGRLLVGTSTARANFFGTTLSAVTQTEGTGGAAGRGSLSVINNDVSNNPPYVLLGRSGAATLGSNAAVVSGSRLGTLTFQGTDGTSFIEAATVAGEVDGTPGTNDMPGRLVFSTTADGAASPTEAMRIKSTGIINFSNAPTYADNTAATVGGLAVGDVYKTVLGVLMIRF
jgi:hypothetical protein